MATQNEIEKQIRRLQRRLADIGPMRPGTLSVQPRNPEERKNPFYQISYTHKGKGRSEYVRPENVPGVREEIENYNRLKGIWNEWIELSIEASRMRYGRRSRP